MQDLQQKYEQYLKDHAEQVQALCCEKVAELIAETLMDFLIKNPEIAKELKCNNSKHVPYSQGNRSRLT